MARYALGRCFIHPFWTCLFTWLIIFCVLADGWAQDLQAAKKVVEIEGVSEYRLSNGCRVVIYPDRSSKVCTVNMTVLVGSRHEGYGESGMAHLLEHMLFKGSMRHDDVDDELKQKGALDSNGATWFDCTTFYETLPANKENLEWAIEMEADRLVNAFIRGEDLASEMTVVRSEFEMSENSPEEILIQRIGATAFEWHNYGKAIIGSRADIERVPLPALRAFYKKYYRPENVVVIVTGKVDEQETLELVKRYFGPLENPREALPATYTIEPTQDGERTVYLRRSGGTPLIGIGYHIPSVAHADFAPMQVLCEVLGTDPDGVLYDQLVKTDLAASVATEAIEYQEPGLLVATMSTRDPDCSELKCQLIGGKFIKAMENAHALVSERQVEQAKLVLANQFEETIIDSDEFATALSDWSGNGDWRLFFLTRDRIEQVTLEDVKRVAKTYLVKSNRTLGYYLPTDTPARSVVPPTPDIEQVVREYRSTRDKIDVAPAFDSTPTAIDKHLQVGQLDSGMPYAMLPKANRGDRFHLRLTLDFGTKEHWKQSHDRIVADLLGPSMLHGTSKLTATEIQEQERQLQADLNIVSQPGLVQIDLHGRKKALAESMDLMIDVLRSPAFPKNSLERFKARSATEVTQGKNDPERAAQEALNRALNPVEESSIQYVPTWKERASLIRSVSVDDMLVAYSQLSGKNGHVSIVGAFDEKLVVAKLNELVGNWNRKAAFERSLAEPQQVAAKLIEITTKDQASAVIARGTSLNANIHDQDWLALTIAADILGGPSLNSRLADNIREKEGLSYWIDCEFNAGQFDSAGTFAIHASVNPSNKAALLKAIDATLTEVKADGFTQEELDASIHTYDKQVESWLSNDDSLCHLIHRQQRQGHRMTYLAEQLDRLHRLTLDEVNAAAHKLIDAEAITVAAGDFTATAQ